MRVRVRVEVGEFIRENIYIYIYIYIYIGWG